MSESTAILPDIRDEATRLTGLAMAAQLPVRLLGGLAIWLRCPSVRSGPFARTYRDMDFATTSSASLKLKALLIAAGYLPDQFFNGLHGESRLYFAAPDERWSIDVVVNELSMSHKLDLRGRLSGPDPTLPLADLLLTKLQVWEINRKDLGDTLCLLADHPILADESAAGDGIGLPRIQAVLGADWGFCHTAERNLGRLAELWGETTLPGAAFDVGQQVEVLRQGIAAAPKTMGWKMRSRVGERVRWYETPEEVGH